MLLLRDKARLNREMTNGFDHEKNNIVGVGIE